MRATDPPPAPEAVASELQPDERLLWFGHPSPRPLERYTMRAFALGVLGAVGVCLVWILFFALVYLDRRREDELTAIYAVLSGLGPVGVRIAAGALGLAGLAGCVGLIRGRWLTPRTVYAVTDRRVLFIRGRAVHWIGHRELRDVVGHQHADGTGDLIFVRNNSSLELLNADEFTAFPRNWWGALLEDWGLSGSVVESPQDPGVREAFVGISRPEMVRDIVLGSLSDQRSKRTR